VSVTHDRMLVDDRRRGLESGQWLVSYAPGTELAPVLVRALATTVRDSIRRWAQLLGTRTHVSPMSSAWLRMHEAEHGKHRAEV
jgi:hypothetical protein